MFDKTINPIEIAAPGTALTGTLLQKGAVTFLGQMKDAFVHIDYVRAALSATGRPRLAVALSRDPPPGPGETLAAAIARITHWAGVTLGDGATLSGGEIEMYYESPDFPTTSGGSYFWPSIDVTGFWWIIVYACDKDGANPGTCAVYLTGGG